MNTTISDFVTTLNTLKSKYRRELFLALGFIVISLLLGWYGFVADDLKLVVLCIIAVPLSIVSLVLSYKKYHGIKPDLTSDKDSTIEMKSQVNFLKSVLKTEKIYNFIGMCSVGIYYLFIFFQASYNVIITILFAITLIGIIVLLSQWQHNKIGKLEQTIKILENSII